MGRCIVRNGSDLSEVPSIGGLTYRFLHKEIKDAAQYTTLKKKRLCQRVANQCIYGKTPVRIFISIESFVLLAVESNPEAAFRCGLERTFVVG